MSVYIHGTTAEEQRRLSLGRGAPDDALRFALVVGVRGVETMGEGRISAERIIDFGSGLGQFSRAMARAVPRGRVLGIERNEEQLAGAYRVASTEGESNLVEFRRGDVLNLELAREEWGSFDLAHARFILEHVPDPLRVVQTTDADDFAASVERDLANLPTIEETDRR